MISIAGCGAPPSAQPDVTIIARADDGLAALLDEVRDAEDPAALLEAALEDAFEHEDASLAMDVVRALDRIEPVHNEARIRERAKRWQERRAQRKRREEDE